MTGKQHTGLYSMVQTWGHSGSGSIMGPTVTGGLLIIKRSDSAHAIPAHIAEIYLFNFFSTFERIIFLKNLDLPATKIASSFIVKNGIEI